MSALNSSTTCFQSAGSVVALVRPQALRRVALPLGGVHGLTEGPAPRLLLRLDGLRHGADEIVEERTELVLRYVALGHRRLPMSAATSSAVTCRPSRSWVAKTLFREPPSSRTFRNG